MFARSWKTGAAAVVLCVVLAAVAGCSRTKGKQLYTARTTLMEATGLPGRNARTKLATLAQIGGSRRVLERAADTLSNLGLKSDPAVIVDRAVITPIKGTDLLAIEVTLPSGGEAKVAADVIAAEFKCVHAEIFTSPARQNREFIEAQIAPVLSAMNRANESLYRYRKTHRKPDAKLEQLETEAKAATETYLTMRRRLTEAQAEEQQASSANVLRTIDPAYVFPIP